MHGIFAGSSWIIHNMLLLSPYTLDYNLLHKSPWPLLCGSSLLASSMSYMTDSWSDLPGNGPILDRLDYPKKSMADHGWLRYLLLDSKCSKCSKRRQIASSPSRFPALNPTSFVAPTGKWFVTFLQIFQRVPRTLWLAKNVFLLFQSPILEWCLLYPSAWKW